MGLTNFRLSEKEREELKSVGNGSRTRGLRALLEMVKNDMGLGKAKVRVRKEKLGFK